MLKTFSRIGLTLALFWIGQGVGFAQQAAENPDELANQAVAVNPGVKAIGQQVLALKHRADAVQIWMDPVLAVEYSNVPWDSWALGESPMSGVQFRLQQTFPLPGKNSRREAVALSEAQVKQWELEEQKNQLSAMVKSTYWRLALVRQLKQITVRHITLVDQLMEAVRAKYQVGKADQHALLQLDVLQKKLNDDLHDFDRQDRELTAAINAALHRGIVQVIATPPRTAAIAPGKTLEELIALAQKARPWLRQVSAHADTERLAAHQAALERWPDVTLWTGYRGRSASGSDPGNDLVSVGISLPIPFDFAGRYKAKRAEHLANASATDEQYKAVFDRMRAELETALAAWSRAADKAQTYKETLVPGAKSTLDSTLASYQSDRADFASLYQAELQLLEFERAIRIAEATTQIQKTVVEKGIGSTLDLSEN